VIRHGDDFWLVASSFNCTPGLPILPSRDLVNWRLVNHAIQNVPHPRYRDVQLGCGVWAPAIRFYGGRFWIFFPLPDEGIHVTSADHPAGRWSEPWLLQEARGWIDPCPFWDDDGQAYLVHAFANSRAGKKERIHVRPMTPDCRRLLGEGQEVFHTPHHAYLEGPKVHKLDGWYYILAPGGGVPTGSASRRNGTPTTRTRGVRPMRAPAGGGCSPGRCRASTWARPHISSARSIPPASLRSRRCSISAAAGPANFPAWRSAAARKTPPSACTAADSFPA